MGRLSDQSVAPCLPPFRSDPRYFQSVYHTMFLQFYMCPLWSLFGSLGSWSFYLASLRKEDGNYLVGIANADKL